MKCVICLWSDDHILWLRNQLNDIILLMLAGVVQITYLMKDLTICGHRLSFCHDFVMLDLSLLALVPCFVYVHLVFPVSGC